MWHSVLKRWRSASARNRPQASRRTRMMMTLTRRLALVTAMLWFGFGVGGRCEAGITLTTPAGLSPGETFRFVFVTDGTTDALSPNIADYNSFVNTQAGGATYNGSPVSWFAIGSTSSVNAIDNVGQAMAPVYLADGTLVTSSTTSAGLWSGSLLHPIDHDLTGARPGDEVWTGTDQHGSAQDPLGPSTLVFPTWGAGHDTQLDRLWVDDVYLTQNTIQLPMYGISQVLTVGASSVPEPSTLLMAGTALSVVIAFGRSRKRRDQRRHGPVGQTDTTE